MAIAIVILIGLAVFFALPSRGKDAPDPETRLVEVAKEAYKFQRDRLQVGEAGIADVAAWSVRLVDAQRLAGTEKEQDILKAHLDHMKDVEAFTKKLNQVGKATRGDLFLAEFHRLQAEVWLSKAK